MPVGQTHIQGLDGIRALAALIIMFGHTAQPDFALWNGGLCSIRLPVESLSIFFLITGFLATIGHDASNAPLSYYRKKVIRIMPSYYGYMILVLIAFASFGIYEEVSDNRFWYYFFMQGEIPFSTGNGILPFVHLWYIGSIALFYLIFPFLYSGSNKPERLFLILSVIWFLLKLAIYVILGKCVLYRLFGIIRFDTLFFGCAIGMGWRKKNRVFIVLSESCVCFLVSIAAFLFSGLYSRYVPAPVRPEFFAVLYSFLLITIAGSTKVKTVLLDNSVMTKLGKFSYEIYLVHPLIIILLSRFLMNGLQIDLSVKYSLFVYLLVTALTILVSYFLHFISGKVQSLIYNKR